MSVFGEEVFRRSAFKFWVLTPVALFGAAAITLPPHDFTGWFPWLLVVVCDLMLVLLVLALWPYGRVPYVKRALTGLVALAYLAYALDAFVPIGRDGGRGADPWKAVPGLLIIGVPSAIYLCRGRFRWRLAPREIDPEDPLLVAASARARARIPRLIELLPGARHAYAHFEFPGPNGLALLDVDPEDQMDLPGEILWGEIEALERGRLSVRVMTQPLRYTLELDRMLVSLDDLHDWEVEHADGSLEGGFTTRALAAICEREGEDVPPEVRSRLARYRDELEPAA